MTRLSCLILEDEPLAAELMREYIEQIPFLELSGICEDAFSAAAELQKHKIDVLFLDLHLPKIKGFDFLKTLPYPPMVIVTSAYHEYALEGFDLNIVDYLLKPIELPRFMKAVNKLKLKHQNMAGEVIANPEDHVYVSENRAMIRVNFQEILYIESMRQYIKIITRSKSISTKMYLSDFEKQLPEYFIRIHKSFIISRPAIQSYTHKYVTLEKDHIVPIGAAFKEDFIRTIEA
ncbi:MAG: LytTR family DNA-binding domain-containing protein [Saprospiraceae bacterium]